jgi:hypothetical protein
MAGAARFSQPISGRGHRRKAEGLVPANGRLWWPGSAFPDHRPMHQWWVSWLQVKCHRCETRASLPLNAIRRPRDTPIWKLEAALKCRSCRKGQYAPPVHMIKLTERREIPPYAWVHPDEDR